MALIDSGKTFDKEDHHEKMKTRMDNMDNSKYLLNIPAHLHKKVKMKLVKEERNMRTILLEFLEHYISK